MNNYFDDPPLSNLELPPASLPGVSQLYYQHVQSSKDPTRAAKLESAKKKLITAGVVVTEDDSEQVADVKQVRRHVFAGHCMRGNAASTLEAAERSGARQKGFNPQRGRQMAAPATAVGSCFPSQDVQYLRSDY